MPVLVPTTNAIAILASPRKAAVYLSKDGTWKAARGC
jgi:hypothetical protein